MRNVRKGALQLNHEAPTVWSQAGCPHSAVVGGSAGRPGRDGRQAAEPQGGQEFKCSRRVPREGIPHERACWKHALMPVYTDHAPQQSQRLDTITTDNFGKARAPYNALSATYLLANKLPGVGRRMPSKVGVPEAAGPGTHHGPVGCD